jgi:hypothetical protein
MAWQTLSFSSAHFGRDMFALCRAVPYLDHLLCWMEEAHFPILEEDRVLRNQHAALARDGRFEIHLPGTAVVLRSDRSVMLEDKANFFSLRDRPDLILAAGRVGFGHPFTSVLLPGHQTVINVHGERWSVGADQAERAAALLRIDPHEAHAPRPAPLLVTGDANFAHHVWNQLGALDAVLNLGRRVDVAATHQPIAPLAEIFADRPLLKVYAVPSAKLPRLDPRRVLPFPAGGKVVVARVRDRIQLVAARHAPAATRDFLAATRDMRRVWLSVRVDARGGVNLLEALSAICGSLLADENVAIVLDGFSRPNDYGANADYDKDVIERTIAHERSFTDRLREAIVARVGATALARLHDGIGRDLLDSIHLASHCHAYFTHHGTLQHKIGYFTRVPGLVHSNPGILAFDRAGTHRHVMQDPGIVEYIDAGLIDAVAGNRLDHAGNYRFTDIPALVAAVRAFIARHTAGQTIL